jgi:uncharacterized membrane-anchored protein YhcB (DUF1043 family)
LSWVLVLVFAAAGIALGLALARMAARGAQREARMQQAWAERQRRLGRWS